MTARAARAQTTWYVDVVNCAPPSDGSKRDPYCSIEEGITASADGDTVWVAAGTYTGDRNRDLSLFGKLITLKSTDGPEATIIDVEGFPPDSIHRAFFLVHGETNETIIEGFTITGAYLIGDTGGTGFGGGGGGAVYIRESSPTIRNCIIRDNVSAALSPPFPVDGRGAGIYIDGQSNAVIENCIIADNVSARRGGGMYIGYDKSSVIVRNCVISGNSSPIGYGGGGIHNTFGTTTILNTSIVDNFGGGGGGIKNENGEPYLSNCILWGNQAIAGQEIFLQAGLLTVHYSDVQGGLAGVVKTQGTIEWSPGNIDVDPLFVDPLSGDYRLSLDSPCVNVGDPEFVPAEGETDIEGDKRMQNCRVDMGADESPFFVDCNANESPDACELAQGITPDCDVNGIPDTCELDSYGDVDADGSVDLDDLACLLDSLEGLSTCGLPPESLDISPCEADGDLNLRDLVAILNALGGSPACPAPCP